ncbi:MAG: hypothetical protein L3K52_03660 [Candidatus Thiothrix sulfatifontis]|nr:MAG: hypothetical protein L3K52_03660 [Candidatus Thiothrix sulfatifontis]
MSDTNETTGQPQSISSTTPYPQASHICTRHGTATTEQGQRKVYARHTFITRDPHDKVLQYYSEQFGEPREQAGAVCWQQETQNGNQHILVELTVEVPAQSDQLKPQEQGQTLIKSYRAVTSGNQAG